MKCNCVKEVVRSAVLLSMVPQRQKEMDEVNRKGKGAVLLAVRSRRKETNEVKRKGKEKRGEKDVGGKGGN